MGQRGCWQGKRGTLVPVGNRDGYVQPQGWQRGSDANCVLRSPWSQSDGVNFSFWALFGSVGLPWLGGGGWCFILWLPCKPFGTDKPCPEEEAWKRLGLLSTPLSWLPLQIWAASSKRDDVFHLQARRSLGVGQKAVATAFCIPQSVPNWVWRLAECAHTPVDFACRSTAVPKGQLGRAAWCPQPPRATVMVKKLQDRLALASLCSAASSLMFSCSDVSPLCSLGMRCLALPPSPR